MLNQMQRSHASPHPYLPFIPVIALSLLFLSLDPTANLFPYKSSSPFCSLFDKHQINQIFLFNFKFLAARMSSICDGFHQFLPSKKTLLKDINIPPRKLLNRRDSPDFFSDSQRFSFSDDTILQKFLPCNNGRDGDEDDPYSSDYFRIYEFKVRRCTRSRSHDWTDCPFAHPGEKARRRDPRRFHYSGNVCPEFRRGGCSRGDSCEFSHGVFESWLHPARYRTETCKDGKTCTRKVCFFAHSPAQLRILPENSREFHINKKPPISVTGSNHCCIYCRCGASSSPTSPLLGMSHLSPPLSPPLSPAKPQSINPFSPNSRKEAKLTGMGLTEMMSSLEAMSLNEANKTSPARPPWIDVSFLSEENQQHFILSPSIPRFSRSMSLLSRNLNGENKITGENGVEFINSDPDVGWVDELLM